MRIVRRVDKYICAVFKFWISLEKAVCWSVTYEWFFGFVCFFHVDIRYRFLTFFFLCNLVHNDVIPNTPVSVICNVYFSNFLFIYGRVEKEEPKEEKKDAPKQIDMGKEAAIEAEVQAARQRAVVPLEIRMKQFRDMLAEKEVKLCWFFCCCFLFFFWKCFAFNCYLFSSSRQT